MSASRNPDFWRSQEGGEAPTTSASSSFRTDSAPADLGAEGARPDSSARADRKAPPTSTAAPEPTSSPGRGPSTGGGSDAPSPSGLGSFAADKLKGALSGADDPLSQRLTKGGAVAAQYAQDMMGPAKPSKNFDGEVLGKETGKEMIKRGIGKGLVGAGKGALQGGAHGAAIGGIKGAVVGTAEAINAAADAKKAQNLGDDPATAAAGTTKGQSNAGSVLAMMGDSALNKGHSHLVSSLSQKAGTVGSAAKGGAIPTPQELKTVLKAGKTFGVEVTKKTAKEIAIGTAVVLGLAFAAITSITGGSAASVAGVLTAQQRLTNVSCEAPAAASGSTASAGAAPGTGTGSLTPDQTNNAKTIIGIAKTISFDQQGAVIGIMTALDESRLNNLNYGDRDSLGLFQQRPSTGWGTKEQILNPAYAAQAFFLGVGGNSNPGLSSIPNWQKLDPWMAAQSVQRSGTPDGSNYKKDLPEAQSIVTSLWASSDPVPLVPGPNASSSGVIGGNTADGATNTAVSTAGCNSVDTASVIGAGDDYPARNESYGRTEADYAVQCNDSVAGGCRGECVDWASWTLVRSTGSYGSYQVAALGNAESWGTAAQAHGIAVDMNPVAGDVIYFLPGVGGAGGVGHVATVKKVNGNGTVDIEEYNFGGDTPATGGGRYHARTIGVGDASGYIHFLDPNKSADENKANLVAKGILVAGQGKWPRPGAA